VEQLKQEQGMPATVLNRYRNSIGYIYAVYQIGFANQRPAVRAYTSGTGFIVGDGLVATNRRMAEPWYGDSEAEALIHHGACARLESPVVFFPGSPKPVNLSHALVSKTSDLAVLRTEKSNMVPSLSALPLASVVGSPGQLVTVIGYPKGVAGMVAKSPSGVYPAALLPSQRHQRRQRAGGCRGFAPRSLTDILATWSATNSSAMRPPPTAAVAVRYSMPRVK
jgi:hypothetical protein